MKYLIWGISLGIFFIGCSPQASEQADMIISNGKIYTVDPNQPSAEAVAIKGGEIVFVGSNEAVKAWKGSNTESLDLEGQAMIPGFVESHAHLMGVGYNKLQLDLSKAKNYDEVVAMVADSVASRPKGEWILGRGWHQSKWDPQPELVTGYQTHEALSAVSPDHPVVLTHASGHAIFANAKAMEIAGIDEQTTFGDDGEIIRYPNGQATGIFTERASGLIQRHIPPTTEAKDQLALSAAIKTCLEHGVTSFQDAGSSQKSIDLYNQFVEDGKMNIRLWVMLNGRDDQLLQDWYQKGPVIGDQLTVRAIKLYADGALGSRGAWLLKEYDDRPAHFGNAVMPMAKIYQTAVDGLKHGFQVCTHAIGDRANREVLDQYEKAFSEYPEAAKEHRFRIEHAQHLHTDDISRFSSLGVIAAMQGIHMSSDRPWAIDRLGSERILEGAYVWEKLLASGALVINGTDAPVEPINPLASFYASVSRQTLAGTPEGGYEPEQKMTRAQALQSYTLDAAHGAFQEDRKGSISVGKLADFTVLSRDIMTIPYNEILQTKIVYTIVGGKIKYQAP